MVIEKSKMTQSINGKVTREPKKEFSELGKFNWWKADDKDIPYQIAGTLNYIHRHDTQRQQRLIASTRLYGNSLAYSALGASFSRMAASNPSQATQRISFNVCASVIDTLTAHIARNEVTPTFITSGGFWKKQKQAENLSKFVEGCFYENEAHIKIVEAFNDAATWGDGLLHVYRTNDDRVGVERGDLRQEGAGRGDVASELRFEAGAQVLHAPGDAGDRRGGCSAGRNNGHDPGGCRGCRPGRRPS